MKVKSPIDAMDITKGKEYDVIINRKSKITSWIIDDSNTRIFIKLDDDCAHINFHKWEIVQESNLDLELKELKESLLKLALQLNPELSMGDGFKAQWNILKENIILIEEKLAIKF